MDCLFATAVFLLAGAVLLNFIALTLSSWFLFRTKTDLSLLFEWSGLYQTCFYDDECNFDLWERNLEGKIIFFMMIGSSLSLLIGLLFLLLGECKSKKLLFSVSGCFCLIAGLIIIASNTLYTINVDKTPKSSRYSGTPSFGDCYYIAWASASAAILAGFLAIYERWMYKKRPTVIPQAHYVENPLRKRQVNQKRKEAFV